MIYKAKIDCINNRLQEGMKAEWEILVAYYVGIEIQRARIIFRRGGSGVSWAASMRFLNASLCDVLHNRKIHKLIQNAIVKLSTRIIVLKDMIRRPLKTNIPTAVFSVSYALAVISSCYTKSLLAIVSLPRWACEIEKTYFFINHSSVPIWSSKMALF